MTKDDVITLTVQVSVPKAELEDLLTRVGERVAIAIATRPQMSDLTLQVDGERLAEAIGAAVRTAIRDMRGEA